GGRDTVSDGARRGAAAGGPALRARRRRRRPRNAARPRARRATSDPRVVTIDKRRSNDRARLGPEVKPEDVALGAAVTAARVAASLTRLALLPLRAVGQAPVAGSFGESAVRELASAGRAARVDGRAQVMATARSALAAPEMGELIEDAFAGPLPDAVVRGAFDDRVQRRIAAELDDEAVVVV